MNSENSKEKQNKAGNPLFIVIIFATLMAFLFVVPDIYQNLNGQLPSFLGGASNKDSDSSMDNSSPISAFYQLGSNGTLKFNALTFTDISLTEDKILKMTVNVEDTADLDELSYYVEFYQNRKIFVGRRLLHGRVTRNLPIELDVSNLDIDTTTYITISHIEDSTIPPLENDSAALTSITCTKPDESYEYEFYTKKLTKTTQKTTITEPDFDKYADLLLEYQKKEKNYNSRDGIEARIVENNNGTFIFIVEYDNAQVESFSSIGDIHLFDKGTLNSVIKYRMNAEGYECK